MSWSERLSSLDASFLEFEDRTAHMHVGALAVFDGSPPRYEEVMELVRARLPQVPRYRQRLAPVPLRAGRPVWVDDAHLDLEYHVRHTALPAPGDDVQLKRLAARLFSQRLDRDKPLWELWFVEGLAGDRFALVSKTHHCMVDGISGVDIATVLLDGTREARPPRAEPWRPRPAPTPSELVIDALREQVIHPWEVLRDAGQTGSEAQRLLLSVAGGIKPLIGLAQLGQAPASSLNQPIGPHRRFETVQLDLAEIRRIRRVLGGTVNDVILAVVAGALRTLLEERGEQLGPDLRAMVPVSVRPPEGRGTFGNQVTAVFCPLPVAETDPRRRLERVRAAMQDLKQSQQALGALAISKLGDFAPPTLLAQAARLQAHTRFFNLVVTNVPGPQTPLYLLGRRMLGCYPAVPLAANQTVVIGLLSYDGTVGVGLMGDADATRDLPRLGEALASSLAELSALARDADAGAAAE
ncbi:MAG TPA: wax ester/triacylglycerol synthase family O-acyltransferase [Polyangia bacterium]|jgi:WS/DGAT/MGAT family acyltransferase|nr:wax ester/triacylglycerol synthase family O-acyltransferase [Polyangia bacterium]